jgi:predicted AAA+ superfamily ATPase
MSIQILDIVLYSHRGDIRRIPFRPDRVNIITGGNRAGKTALIEIVDYCLGSSECHIPPGL